MGNDLIFKHVSDNNLEKLRYFFEQNNVSGFDGTEGNATGGCLDLDFIYDPATQVLQLNTNKLPKDLAGLSDDSRDQSCKSFIANILGIEAAENPMIMTATDSYPSRPSRYGVYNYVIPYFTNTSGLDFTYSSHSMSHGELRDTPQNIDITASELKIFEADSSKLSGLGVSGTVIYTWGDGATTMNIAFTLNTIFTSSFTIGFSGTNAGKLSQVITKNSPVSAGYTYLDPKATINAS